MKTELINKEDWEIDWEQMCPIQTKWEFEQVIKSHYPPHGYSEESGKIGRLYFEEFAGWDEYSRDEPQNWRECSEETLRDISRLMMMDHYQRMDAETEARKSLF